MKNAPHQPDRIVFWGRSVLQIGPLNHRVYLMHVHPEDCPQVVHWAEDRAEEQNLGKIVAKVPESLAHHFWPRGFGLEARIPGLFHGVEDGLYLSRFIDPTRGAIADAEQGLDLVRSRQEKRDCQELPKGMRLVSMTKNNAGLMAALYAQIFRSYPFPLFDPLYIQQIMHSHVRFYGVFQDAHLLALASCEMDVEHAYVEMTDFATHPLLCTMQTDMAREGLRTAFTIARTAIPGINAVFNRAGYSWAGTLVNNTHMDGGLESMHVWWARLEE